MFVMFTVEALAVSVCGGEGSSTSYERETHTKLYALFTDPRFNSPTVAPNGSYR